ncbi:MAG: NAD(P)/FAD-dependent oxidoreductase, partial [Myxococcota bacterium]
PATMNISGRYIRISREKETSVYINFIPHHTKKQIEEIFQQEIISSGKKRVINLLKRFLPDRLAERILSLSEVPKERIVAELKKEERLRLIENLTNFKINVSGSKGFRTAHITTGGVSVDEVRSNTLESRLVKGLFFAGEILDVDGFEGGYNLHWAFATGYISGKNVAK